jgi:P4 family phage/plasmid primase-like protien
MTKEKPTFLDSFPDHVYRYIDQTGECRPPVVSATKRDDLNVAGYEAYFTVNGFKNFTGEAKKENCSSLNSFFVDIDGRKDLDELEVIKKKLEPTYILETKNGYHLYWLLDEPIWKEDNKDWDEQVAKWEKIEQAIVTALKADDKAKDVCRILRQPGTFYWKKTGDAYKKGTEGAFKIKGLYKNLSANYTLDEVAEVFPIKEEEIIYPTYSNPDKMQRYAENERKDFFAKVNAEYPIEERDSFNKLISGLPETLPPNTTSRNEALLITATLMRDAKWNRKKAVDHIAGVGWHGIEKERGGMQEIFSTIKSAYENAYTYSYKNPIIDWNMSENEQALIQSAYIKAHKEREKKDKARFVNYEREIIARYPHMKRNEAGIVFNYHNGYYKQISDHEVEAIILNALYDDMLWNYRTVKNVRDKMSCLLSLLPQLKLTNDKGEIANVKNGLLNIYTRELKPHTPDFISLTQFPTVYDKGASCPLWIGCMDAWTEGKEQEDKKLLLQQFAGYLLSSSMYWDKALFLVGDGGNGKSTFVNTLAMVLGDESTSYIDLDELYAPFGMKGLIGKRLNIVEEVPGNYYQSNKLKKLISGEEITINIKYKDQMRFSSQVKFCFAVNIMPRVDDTTTATERRMAIVLFKNNFRDHPNVELRSSRGLLAQELSGVLNWMLEGAVKLKDNRGFLVTNEQKEALGEYRQENSSVEGFISDCLAFAEGKIVDSAELYKEYQEWCKTDGRKFKSKISFTKEMTAYGERYKKFSFFARGNSKENSHFEGVFINDGWASASTEQQYKNL